MNSLTKLQKNVIFSSAVATTALVLSGTESETRSQTNNNEPSAEKKTIQSSTINFQKSELKISKIDLTLIKTASTKQELETNEPVWPKDMVLSIGDEGKKVKEVQSVLHDGGYYLSTIDGVFGPKTKKAIYDYQKKHGLQIDGIVGKETISTLIGTKTKAKNDLHVMLTSQHVLPPVFQTGTHLSNDLTSPFMKDQSDSKEEAVNYLQYGDQNEEVSLLQQKLKKAGYYDGSTDGIYGSYTQQAVRTLQKHHSLQVDGLAGEEIHRFLTSTDLSELARKKEQIVASSSPSETQSSSENNQSDNQSSSSSSNSNLSDTSTTSNSSSSSSDSSSHAEDEKEDVEEKPEPESKSQTVTVSSSKNMISEGKDLIGTPYQWGGTTPSGFDCSGFLNYVFDRSGVDLPRTVAEIWNATNSVSSPKKGDLVFFETYKSGPSHAGIYLGNGTFLHAGSSTGVTISEMNSTYWGERYLGGRSIK
ncbi:peptidoglycan-binding protein [Salipaludibacillus daqingensis]|uniref:C40 family peptidase n=1 Tax=Salipaludibacillus daqingensis TaxID=3041001 RepID=UPI00247688E1|nr:peptidoglycan-binding protein [Salipaludibacillus daqingensis]